MRLIPDKLHFATIVDRHTRTNFNKSYATLCTHIKHSFFSRLFSANCLLEKSGGNLFQVTFDDGLQKLVEHNGIELLADSSSVKLLPLTSYQLATDLQEHVYKRTFYKLSPASLITLCVEQTYDGIVNDAWFEIGQSLVDNPLVLQDISTFLS